MNPVNNNLPASSNQNYHQDMIEVHRSLNRIESAVMDLRSIVLRHNRTTSSSRHPIRDRSTTAPVAIPTGNRRTAHSRQAVIASIPRTSRPQQLLQEIANLPVRNTVCWYHRQFGIAANPAHCTPGCTFVAPPQIEEIRNAQRSSSAARRSRINPAPISAAATSSIASHSVVNTIPVAAAVPNVPITQVAAVSNPEQMATDQMDDDLLNLSDSD